METQIKDALIALLAGIKAADGQAIADQMARLDDFLENRSYAKALLFLGG